jgi:two-component system nitrate/nitrite response regulator NarP
MARLLIVDDHPLFLKGLHRFLVANGHEVACCAHSAGEVFDKLATETVEVVLLDVSMKGEGGLDVLKALRDAGNQVPVIFLTASISGQDAVTAIKLGVNGIVLKASDPDKLLRCIEAVMAGTAWTDPEVMEAALHHSLSPQRAQGRPEQLLTGRELEIARLVKKGHRNRDIAQQCNLTEGTVKAHLHSIFRKLEVGSRSELILKMLELENPA